LFSERPVGGCGHGSGEKQIARRLKRRIAGKSWGLVSAWRVFVNCETKHAART
jgi:hypothetical protein